MDRAVCIRASVHLRVDPGLLHLLATAAKAAVGAGVRISASLFSVLLGMYIGVELLEHMAILCLTS